MALSNMPEKKVEILLNNTKRVQFMDTPLMSTYILAFIIGKFDYIQTTTNRGTLVRVITPTGKSSSGEFALDCAVKTLELYEKWFKIDYQLPKLDNIAITEFESGAMENWGLVT